MLMSNVFVTESFLPKPIVSHVYTPKKCGAGTPVLLVIPALFLSWIDLS